MPTFSIQSLGQLKTCHINLISLFNLVIVHYDCKIVTGFRNKIEQDELYYSDPPRTRAKFPDSMHNRYPSHAVDVVPYPIDYSKLDKMDWREWCRFYYFIGVVREIARTNNIKVRCGGDWDNDMDLNDQKFNDLPHWEIIAP